MAAQDIVEVVDMTLAIERIIKNLLALPFGDVHITKHQNEILVEETKKTKIRLK